MRPSALGVRRLDRDGPGLAVWPHTHRPHLAVNPYESGGNPMIAQGLGQAVDAITLGDTVEVERDGRGLANVVAVELQDFMRRATRVFHRCADAIRRDVSWPEAPSFNRVAHADNEGPAGGAPDLQAEAYHLAQSRGNSDPFADRRRIEPLSLST